MGASPASRRAALQAAGLALGAALVVPGASKAEGGEEVSATEDLMREHGVLRRILVLYRETAHGLRAGANGLDAGALAQAADLFRRFGEDYHETQLEEGHVFPAVQKAGGPAAELVGVLKAQHARGREINGFVTAKCAKGRIGAGDAEPLARALESFARMYEAHAAVEDTIVFQAWRSKMSKRELEETGERFEKLERDRFHGDGFDMAADEVATLERRLGFSGLDRYTAPPPA